MKSPVNEILVSIWMVSFNHEKYIKDAIESVINQKTNFKFKLFIGEDNSKDNTRDVCLAFKEQYPELIEIILNDKNYGSNTNGIKTYERVFRSNAKYIAMLEGDDYWTDSYKLQKQVDFLEANEEYVMSFHDAVKYSESKKKLEGTVLVPGFKRSFYKDEVKLLKAYYPTLTVCFRNIPELKQLHRFIKDVPNGDIFLFSFLGNFGGAHYHNDIENAVYRIHDGGVWSNKTRLYYLTNSRKSLLALYNMYKYKNDETACSYFGKNISLTSERAFLESIKLKDQKKFKLFTLAVKDDFKFLKAQNSLYFTKVFVKHVLLKR